MCNRVLQETKSKRGEEIVISYFPLSHVATQLLDIYFPLAAGASVWFAQPDALKICIILTDPEQAYLDWSGLGCT